MPSAILSKLVDHGVGVGVERVVADQLAEGALAIADGGRELVEIVGDAIELGVELGIVDQATQRCPGWN